MHPEHGRAPVVGYSESACCNIVDWMNAGGSEWGQIVVMGRRKTTQRVRINITGVWKAGQACAVL